MLHRIVGQGGWPHPARHEAEHALGQGRAVRIGCLPVSRPRSVRVDPLEAALANEKSDVLEDVEGAGDRRAAKARRIGQMIVAREDPPAVEPCQRQDLLIDTYGSGGQRDDPALSLQMHQIKFNRYDLFVLPIVGGLQSKSII